MALMDSFSELSTQFGVSLGLIIFIIAIIYIWSLCWKLAALWKSARKGSIVWFIILAVVNTIGILEILYIFIFSEMKFPKRKSKKSKGKKK